MLSMYVCMLGHLEVPPLTNLKKLNWWLNTERFSWGIGPNPWMREVSMYACIYECLKHPSMHVCLKSLSVYVCLRPVSMYVCLRCLSMYVCLQACMYVWDRKSSSQGWVRFLTENVQYWTFYSIFWDLWGGVLLEAPDNHVCMYVWGVKSCMYVCMYVCMSPIMYVCLRP